MGFKFNRRRSLAFGSLSLLMGLLVVTFQNCSGSVNNPVSFISEGEAYPNGKLPNEISLEAYPPTPTHGEFVYLQPTFYETARTAHEWGSYKYEWLHDGQVLTDQTGVQLEIKSFAVADEGNYQLLVTDSHRTVPSKQFQLTNSDLARLLPITITIAASPAKQIVGGSISLQLQKDVTKDWTYFNYEWGVRGKLSALMPLTRLIPCKRLTVVGTHCV